MNIHIELVKKWLADPASVTQKELENNAYAAAAHAAYAAYDAAAHAAAYAVDAANAAANAAYWIKRYEELEQE